MYTIGIRLYTLVLQTAALFHPKARLWTEGRRQWRSRYRQAWQIPAGSKVLWVHAASLGEFEQGRPLIETFRAHFPEWKIALTFFSPSGYEIRKNYAEADWIGYLPADTPDNAEDFLEILRPTLALFIKYEFWGNYLFALQKRQIPTMLISALFRPDQPFFQWYGAYWRRMLGCFAHIFVQNQESLDLLSSIQHPHATVAGDTRIDRVLALPDTAPENAIAAAFAAQKDKFILIAGSTWTADEAVLLPMLNNPGFQAWKIVIAPHEPSADHLERLERQILKINAETKVVRYSQSDPNTVQYARVLIIDNIGMLSSLYRYGYAAYIGGGFGRGIHNTLEPAAFGLPVLFGPKYEKFEEARQMTSRGGAFPSPDSPTLQTVLRQLEYPGSRQKASGAVAAYLSENKGATEKILAFIRRVIQE